MDGFDSGNATHLHCSPKYTSVHVSFDNDLIHKAILLGFHTQLQFTFPHVLFS